MYATDPLRSSLFEDLPDELILEIVGALLPVAGFFPTHKQEVERQAENVDRVNALWCLTLTSRRCNALSTPLLYRSYIRTASHPSSFLLFLRSVLARSETAHYLRYVELRDVPLNISKKDSHLQALWGVLRYRAGMLQTGARWQLACAATVLFGLANNITELALDRLSYESISSFFDLDIGRLQRLSIRHLRANDAIDLTIVAPLVSSRSEVWTYFRETLSPFSRLHGVGDDVRLHELVLNNCNLSPHNIDHLLRRCGSITRFTCRWVAIDLALTARPINLRDLARLLSRFHHSLEYLELNTLESGWEVTLDEEIPTIGSLRDFCVLKQLDVSGLVLWSDDDTAEHPPLASILPRSLESLTIQVEWDDYVEDSLMALSSDAVSQLPFLKTIDCSWRPASTETAPVLRDMFEAVGIDLKLTTTEDG